MNANVLVKTIEPIVVRHMKGELPVFQVDAIQQAERLLSGKEPAVLSGKPTAEFGVPVVELMEFIVLLWGTIQAVEGIWKRIGEIGTLPDKAIKECLTSTWRDKLVEAGLSKKKAQEIVSEFQDAILRALLHEKGWKG